MKNEDFNRMLQEIDAAEARLGHPPAVSFEETTNGLRWTIYDPEEEPRRRKRKKNKSQRARQAASREAIPEATTEDTADCPSPVPPQQARMESRSSSAASTRSYAEVVQHQVSDVRSRSSSIMSVRSAQELAPPTKTPLQDGPSTRALHHARRLRMLRRALRTTGTCRGDTTTTKRSPPPIPHDGRFDKRPICHHARSKPEKEEASTDATADSPSPIPPQSARLESRPSSAASTRSYAEVVQQEPDQGSFLVTAEVHRANDDDSAPTRAAVHPHRSPLAGASKTREPAAAAALDAISEVHQPEGQATTPPSAATPRSRSQTTQPPPVLRPVTTNLEGRLPARRQPEPPPQLPRITAVLDEKQVDVLVDTGATDNFIRAATSAALVRRSAALHLRTAVTMQGPALDGTQVLPLQLGPLKQNAEFYTTPHLRETAKIGYKFLEEQRAVINNSRRCAFSTLDLRSGYWQVPMEANSRKCTVFPTPRRRLVSVPGYAFRTQGGTGHLPTPYGARSVNRLPPRVRHGIPGRRGHLLVQPRGAHTTSTSCVRAATDTWTPMPTAEVSFRPIHLEQIRAATPPTNQKELRAFLGVCGWLREYVAGFAELAAPLTDLLVTKQKWSWKEAEAAAFDAVKDALANPLPLHGPDPALT
ncbi:hypothetical protein ILUMI_07846 [Ignelater luminosus]|uniref:RNA-directed DNA polymerase n=1 Tax=Ignelater luminosus TaxID=2038154 RepID=A0A8K0D333_IGNLU|nr:hypothetical protein ILUMI_07846 [Ignelater luminosus]